MARTRYVHSDDMVAHIWAAQSQDSARNSRNTFYFSGSTIYSYGSHFPIAQHVTRGKGKREKRAVLFTTREYSNTTAKHKRMTENAVRGRTVPVIYVESVPRESWHAVPHKENLAFYARMIKDALTRAVTARTRKAEYIADAMHYADMGNRYALFYGLKKRFTVTEYTREDLEREREKERAAREKRETASRKLAEEREAKRREVYEQWKLGADVHGYMSDYPLALRIKGDMVETSWGAEVSLDHALRLLALVRRVVASGAPQASDPMRPIRVGHFTLDSIAVDGTVSIGCHHIPLAEIDRIAREYESRGTAGEVA